MIQHNLPDSVKAIAVLLLLTATGCTPIGTLNALVPFTGYKRTTNIAYGLNDRQRLDVYRPSNSHENDPVVIFFYGGGWQSGERGDYRFVGQALASRGYVTVIPDYRLYPQVVFPAFVQDSAQAARWVHDNISRFGGDAQRVYLMGHSAGAHIAALLTLDEHYLSEAGVENKFIRGTVGLAGPYDFTPGPEDRDALGQLKSDDDVKLTQPLHFADGHKPPMLLIQGSADKIVEPGNASRLAERIQSKGGNARAIYYKNAGHAQVVLALAWPFQWLEPTLADSIRFFEETDANLSSASAN